jgi:hypothetical protein
MSEKEDQMSGSNGAFYDLFSEQLFMLRVIACLLAAAVVALTAQVVILFRRGRKGVEAGKEGSDGK